jgi:Flp pilus assembly protein TadD
VPVSNRHRVQRVLREAEGYLELGMAAQCLQTLARVADAGTFRAQRQYLRGEALRMQERFDEALPSLEEAADLAPSNVHAWMALGWCYKRLERLESAIQALRQAEEVAPHEAVVQYNLACYYSLAGDKPHAISHLSQALNLDPRFRDLVGGEADFDRLRTDPDFRALVSVVV